jgi:hypothetical protein
MASAGVSHLAGAQRGELDAAQFQVALARQQVLAEQPAAVGLTGRR